MYDLNLILEDCKEVAYTIDDNGMAPLLRKNIDEVVIRARTEGFAKNDVVLFMRKDGECVLRRIRKILPDKAFFVAGDRSLTGEVITQDQIIGILTQIRREESFSTQGKRFRLVTWLLALYRLKIRVVPLIKWPIRKFKGAVHRIIKIGGRINASHS